VKGHARDKIPRLCALSELEPRRALTPAVPDPEPWPLWKGTLTTDLERPVYLTLYFLTTPHLDLIMVCIHPPIQFDTHWLRKRSVSGIGACDGTPARTGVANIRIAIVVTAIVACLFRVAPSICFHRDNRAIISRPYEATIPSSNANVAMTVCTTRHIPHQHALGLIDCASGLSQASRRPCNRYAKESCGRPR